MVDYTSLIHEDKYPAFSKPHIKEALDFMADAHSGQVRKGTDKPYITHTVEAGEIASEITDNEDVVIAALLHDTIEDAGKTVEELKDRFGERVAEIVAAESEKKEDSHGDRPWEVRKQETIDEISACEDEDMLIVCLADKLSNMRAIYNDYMELGDKLWERFNMTDSAMQGWYYSSLAEALSKKLGEYPAWKELNEKIQTVFK